MKTLKKIKNAVKKEFGEYSIEKKRKLFIRCFILFVILFILKLSLDILKITSVKDNNQGNFQQIEQPSKQSGNSLSHDEMMENLQKMKKDIQNQRKIYEKNKNK